MIGYVTLGTNNLNKSAKFYDNLLAEIEAKRLMETDEFILWGTDIGQPGISITKPFNGQGATVGNGVMVGIALETPDQVDALYAKAMALGAEDEGQPGLREEGFYAAYFRDLDGNKLNFFCLT
jgi:predicted lactoylglutathione lyase